MQANAIAAPATQPRVFVVEDSAAVLERIEALITLAGARSAGHASGVEVATRAIIAERPEIVLLDVQLADGSGFDVLRTIREQAPEIDIYMLSNFSADPYRQLAAKLGARGFFDKSSEIGRLRELIAQRVAARH